MAGRLATPVLTALAERRLKIAMPIESHPASKDRPDFAHLEVLGRLLAGLAPWLELGGNSTPEGRERARLTTLARTGIDAATDPDSPDLMNFAKGQQPLVDAAFLAQALLRAPKELWGKLEPRVQKNVIAAMMATRVIRPGENNWKLFARSATNGSVLERAHSAHDVAESLVGRESACGPCAQEPEVEAIRRFENAGLAGGIRGGRIRHNFDRIWHSQRPCDHVGFAGRRGWASQPYRRQ